MLRPHVRKKLTRARSIKDAGQTAKLAGVSCFFFLAAHYAVQSFITTRAALELAKALSRRPQSSLKLISKRAM
jgi:hypothetical protein